MIYWNRHCRTMGWRTTQHYFLTVMKQVFLWITCQRRLSHQLLSSTCIPQHPEMRHTSVLAWVSASGQVLPPMVLLEGKHLQNSLPVGEEPGTMHGMGSGWMDSELFQMWFFNHFLKLVPKRRETTHFASGWPLLAFQYRHDKDGCRKSIIIFCSPPLLQHPCLSTTRQNMLFTTQAILVTAMHTVPDEESLQKTHKVLLFQCWSAEHGSKPWHHEMLLQGSGPHGFPFQSWCH